MRPGAIIGEKYSLERPLSRGGMGSVWKGRHVQLGVPLALKFMDPAFVASPSFRARFEREARAAASLHSPHVVHVQDYGIEGDTPYLVMELLEGEDLFRRLQRRGRLSLPEVYRILAQLGRALRRAHGVGLVHRDLKPSNVFLAHIDDEEVVKVLDFGIAKDISADAAGDTTATGPIMGSPSYMSPEQLRNARDVDTRSDLWAVGVMLYRAVTGHAPFRGDQVVNIIASVLTDRATPPSLLVPDLPLGMDDYFRRALSRDREARFQTIGEMVDTFAVLIGEVPPASVQLAPLLPEDPARSSDPGSLTQGLRTDELLVITSATQSVAVEPTVGAAGLVRFPSSAAEQTGRAATAEGGRTARAAWVALTVLLLVAAGGGFRALRGARPAASDEATGVATAQDATAMPGAGEAATEPDLGAARPAPGPPGMAMAAMGAVPPAPERAAVAAGAPPVAAIAAPSAAGAPSSSSMAGARLSSPAAPPSAAAPATAARTRRASPRSAPKAPRSSAPPSQASDDAEPAWGF